MKPYDHKDIEEKWQKEWKGKNLYKVRDKVEGKQNFYELVEFTYPSGNLHVGHWYAYAVPDIHARFKRMQGFNVLYPIGFDAFGLPAENAAIKLGADPKVWTYEQMEKMRTQLRSMGAIFDWAREVVSCAPEYYKWTQWMFNQFLKHDLVYRAVTMVNWCPKDQTILANEQVTDGKCERCGTDVIQREQPQWMLRITKYADRLIDDLDTLDWPHAIKESQKNWIGRSEGSEITFKLSTGGEVKVFTTRADTLFGVTYIVLAPEHSLVPKLISDIKNKSEVESYIETTKKKLELERQQSKEKTGVELKGITAINPANGEEVPVWIADYVLAGYGTGVVMAVPAHDERDFEFAKKYDLPIKTVVVGNYPTVTRVTALLFTSDKKLILQSWNIEDGKKLLGRFGGHTEKGENIFQTLKRELQEELELDVNNHTHFFLDYIDNHENEGDIVFVVEGVDSSKLVQHEGDEIVELKDDFSVEGLSENTKKVWKRYLDNKYSMNIEYGIVANSSQFDGLTSQEAKTKITDFVGGKMISTYRLRDWGISRQRYWGTPIPIVYDPEGKAHPVPDEHLPWILPSDVDHTPDGTSPLARSKELFERTEKIFGPGWKPEVETMDTFVDSTWYFYRYLDNHNADAFADKEKMDAWMPLKLYMGGAEHTTMHLLYSRFWTKALQDLGLVKDGEAFNVRRNRGLILGPDGNKMSKSKGNVINPDEIVDRLGADTVRMYLAFMGPYGVTTNYPWDSNGVVGVRRFLERVWKLKEKIGTGEITSLLHKTIKKISEDIEEYKFNTSISAMMILLNAWEKADSILQSEYKILLQLLAPFAPHMTEELWRELGENESIHLSQWPIADEALLVDDTVTIGVQINGKVRDELTIAVSATKEVIEHAALELTRIKEYVAGKNITKTIIVPGRIINILTD